MRGKVKQRRDWMDFFVCWVDEPASRSLKRRNPAHRNVHSSASCPASLRHKSTLQYKNPKSTYLFHPFSYHRGRCIGTLHLKITTEVSGAIHPIFTDKHQQKKSNNHFPFTTHIHGAFRLLTQGATSKLQPYRLCGPRNVDKMQQSLNARQLSLLDRPNSWRFLTLFSYVLRKLVGTRSKLSRNIRVDEQSVTGKVTLTGGRHWHRYNIEISDNEDNNGNDAHDDDHIHSTNDKRHKKYWDRPQY